MPTQKLTHKECLYRLCLFCHQKHKLVTLTSALILKIEKLGVIKDLNAPHIAKAICEPCRAQFYKPEGQATLKQRRVVSLPDADDLVSICYDSNTCPCKICEIVKTNQPPTASKRKVARPSIPTAKVARKNTSVKESASKVHGLTVKFPH